MGNMDKRISKSGDLAPGTHRRLGWLAIGVLVLTTAVWAAVLVRLVTFGLPDDGRIEAVLAGRDATIAQRTALDQQRTDFFNEVKAQRKQLGDALLHGRGAPDHRVKAFEQLYTKKTSFDDPAIDESVRIALLRNALTWGLYDDESLTLSALSRIRPKQFDFDPKTYYYGGAYLYPTGVAIFGFSLLGVITVHKLVSDYLETPGDMASLYVIARGLLAIAFLVLIALTFALARRLTGDAAAIFSVLALAGASGVWRFAFLAKPHVWAAVWAIAAIYALLRANSDTDDRQNWWIVAAGLASGMAMGSALGHATVAFAAPVFLWREGDAASARKISIVWLVTALTWAVSNPYIIIHFGEFLLDFQGGGVAYGRTSFDLEGVTKYFHLMWVGLGPLTSLAAIAGIAVILADGSSAQRRLVTLTALSCLIGAAFEDIRLTLFVLPLLCVVAGIGISAVFRVLSNNRRGIVGALAAALLIVQTGAVLIPSMMLLDTIEKRTADFRDWVRTELPPTASIGINAYSIKTDFVPPLFDREVYDVRPETLQLARIDHPARTVDYVFLYGTWEPTEPWSSNYDTVFAARWPPAPDWMRNFFRFPDLPWNYALEIRRRRE